MVVTDWFLLCWDDSLFDFLSRMYSFNLTEHWRCVHWEWSTHQDVLICKVRIQKLDILSRPANSLIMLCLSSYWTNYSYSLIDQFYESFFFYLGNAHFFVQVMVHYVGGFVFSFRAYVVTELIRCFLNSMLCKDSSSTRAINFLFFRQTCYACIFTT
jgi:hypothetical protein